MSLINREDLIAEYNRVHVGAPGGALKLMVNAPEVQPDRMKLVQQAVNTIMSTSRSYSIRDRAFRNAARLVQCAIDGESPDFEQIPEGDEMPPEPKWIPCSERLPEKYGWCLCTLKDYRVNTYYWNNKGEWIDNGKKHFFELYNISSRYTGEDITAEQEGSVYWTDWVIAWMPLPGPYQEEGEQDG